MTSHNHQKEMMMSENDFETIEEWLDYMAAYEHETPELLEAGE